ncbi:hypothetical protein [Deinococcus depolymerans]|uniref:DUF5666 domain-containing protein n=1 Tax=Deinococcus depolymerans TaxID=392408 RepID=A0ABP3MIS6_9DEIO
MKKFWLSALACVLVACGAAGGVPDPQAGDLLSAPTTLIRQGQVLTAQATATLYGGGLGVRVQVGAATADRMGAASLDGLTLDGVFVVTGAGVWKAPLRVTAPASSAPGTLSASAWSGSGRLRPGSSVQVVVRLKDRLGHTYWLRDTSRAGG